MGGGGQQITPEVAEEFKPLVTRAVQGFENLSGDVPVTSPIVTAFNPRDIAGLSGLTRGLADPLAQLATQTSPFLLQANALGQPIQQLSQAGFSAGGVAPPEQSAIDLLQSQFGGTGSLGDVVGAGALPFATGADAASIPPPDLNTFNQFTDAQRSQLASMSSQAFDVSPTSSQSLINAARVERGLPAFGATGAGAAAVLGNTSNAVSNIPGFSQGDITDFIAKADKQAKLDKFRTPAGISPQVSFLTKSVFPEGVNRDAEGNIIPFIQEPVRGPTEEVVTDVTGRAFRASGRDPLIGQFGRTPSLEDFIRAAPVSDDGTPLITQFNAPVPNAELGVLTDPLTQQSIANNPANFLYVNNLPDPQTGVVTRPADLGLVGASNIQISDTGITATGIPPDPGPLASDTPVAPAPPSTIGPSIVGPVIPGPTPTPPPGPVGTASPNTIASPLPPGTDPADFADFFGGVTDFLPPLDSVSSPTLIPGVFFADPNNLPAPRTQLSSADLSKRSFLNNQGQIRILSDGRYVLLDPVGVQQQFFSGEVSGSLWSEVITGLGPWDPSEIVPGFS